MLTGGTGLKGKVPDSRITGVHNTAPYSTLPPGPFQLTNSKGADTFPYDSYAASPVHRFYQMWQQEDCNVSHATAENPSGCLADYFTWTEVTVGSNNNGKAQPSNFSTDYAPGKVTTGEGATSMGFYNMLQGDAPYTKDLADHYALLILGTSSVAHLRANLAAVELKLPDAIVEQLDAIARSKSNTELTAN
jgi:phospholipase C